MAENSNTNRIQSLLSKIKGDKVVWMIVLMLMLLSLVCLFSSTSQMAKHGRTRLGIAASQLVFTGIGALIIIGCYKLKTLKPFKVIARFGFIISLGMLLILMTHISLGPIVPSKINDAWRVLKIGGFQLHVFEVTKVLMVMYLAWAMDELKKGRTPRITNFILAFNKKYTWARKDWFKEVWYIYAPIGIVTVLIFGGSGSSALFTAAICGITVFVAGLNMKKVFQFGALIAVLVLGVFGMHKLSGGKMFERIATMTERMKNLEERQEVKDFENDEPYSKKYYADLAAFQQQFAAKQAIKEGGLIGKGAGNSTQRYMVPMIFEDFMYSFIIEEYGLFGGLFVLALFLSLLARGDIIAKNCEDPFGKMTVAGLVMLISFQALMHMAVNVGLIPMTGQTLPLVSFGRSAFLTMCFAFGVILSISKMTTKKVEKEMQAETPLIEKNDEIQNSMYDLDQMEDQL